MSLNNDSHQNELRAHCGRDARGPGSSLELEYHYAFTASLTLLKRLSIIETHAN
jgi:hypothetical protein